ncbi:threonine/serine exporter family protein [Bacillus horti]
MEICLLAGEIMLKYGAETYRVEETMERMAGAKEMKDVHSYVTPTGIFFSFKSADKVGERSRIIRIDDRLVDLNKVTLVNDLSRRFVNGQLSLDEAEKALKKIDRGKMLYSVPLQHAAAGLAGGSFAILFGGDYIDFIPAFIAGALVNICLYFLQLKLQVKFIAELFSACIGGMSCILLFNLGLGNHLDQIIIGSLMPLVPGLPLTNAVRDIMAGDLVSGVGRGAEALLTALSIATGIAIAISLFL